MLLQEHKSIYLYVLRNKWCAYLSIVWIYITICLSWQIEIVINLPNPTHVLMEEYDCARY